MILCYTELHENLTIVQNYNTEVRKATRTSFFRIHHITKVTMQMIFISFIINE